MPTKCGGIGENVFGIGKNIVGIGESLPKSAMLRNSTKAGEVQGRERVLGRVYDLDFELGTCKGRRVPKRRRNDNNSLRRNANHVISTHEALDPNH